MRCMYFIGSGTMGPVSPLLALAEDLKLKHPEVKIIWFGTSHFESSVVSPLVQEFRLWPIWKLRRHFSLKNLSLAFIEPLKIIFRIPNFIRVAKHEKPLALISAGGFLAVPLAWAVKLFTTIPVIIHQQDLSATLTNRLIAAVADQITISAEPQARFFSQSVSFIGQPVRRVFRQAEPVIDEILRNDYALDPDRPLVLILGGGTGAMDLNQLVLNEFYPHLISRQVNYVILHLTGPGKKIDDLKPILPVYNCLEFLPAEKLAPLMARSSLIISRSGWNALAELGVLKKSAFILPLPNSPQEISAQYFLRRQATLPLPTSGEWHRRLEFLLQPAQNSMLKQYGQRLGEFFPAEATAKFIRFLQKKINL